MPHLPAAILVFLERPFPDRQEQVAMEYAAAHHLEVVAWCSTVDAALALVLAGTVYAVVCALTPHDGGAIEKAGGQLHVVRREDHRKRRSLDRLCQRLARLGLDVPKIAQVLEIDTGEVRRLLGQRRQPDQDSGAE